jgi:hypothetical protein
MSWNLRVFLSALALFALVIGVATRSHAADVTLSWTLPTTYEDETPIGDGELRESVAEWIACSGTWPAAGSPASAVYPYPVVSASITGLGVGTWCFRVAVLTTSDVQSEWSNVATKAVELPPPPKPKPPVLVTVDIQTTALLEENADGSLKLTVR